ncbi:hypothetical protein NIES2134_102810 [Thermostichus vulcanus NIES-2134]|nr:hypothetical protein NIES2134_102810 [Thermostichus vulcanus NIES-2134]
MQQLAADGLNDPGVFEFVEQLAPFIDPRQDINILVAQLKSTIKKHMPPCKPGRPRDPYKTFNDLFRQFGVRGAQIIRSCPDDILSQILVRQKVLSMMVKCLKQYVDLSAQEAQVEESLDILRSILSHLNQTVEKVDSPEHILMAILPDTFRKLSKSLAIRIPRRKKSSPDVLSPAQATADFTVEEEEDDDQDWIEFSNEQYCEVEMEMKAEDGLEEEIEPAFRPQSSPTTPFRTLPANLLGLGQNSKRTGGIAILPMHGDADPPGYSHHLTPGVIWLERGKPVSSP